MYRRRRKNMLCNLIIKNYALIKHLELSPSKGLNIITGETGAGKSIMLGAVGLLMGNRADTKSLYDENEKCVIEGEFNVSELNIKALFDENDIDYDDVCLIRREISPAGKSRAYINDTPVNLDILKTLGVFLMDIHSQHDTIMLGINTFQLSLLDSFAQNKIIYTDYQSAYSQYNKAEKALKKLEEQALVLKKEHDYNTFLLDELVVANLQNEEQELLEEELVLLENAEEIKRKLSLAYEYLNNGEQSALQFLKESNASLSSIAGLSSKYASLRERLTSSIIEVKDIIDEVQSLDLQIETNEERILELRDRINLIFKLLQKHGFKTIQELNELKIMLEEKVSRVKNMDESLTRLTNERDAAHKSAKIASEKLSKSRATVISPLEKMVKKLLAELGMPDANLSIQTSEKELTLDGKDEISFLFSANKGISLKTLKEVASGGEFSRLMLAFKYILAQKSKLPTIIFDEIDTGISGEVAIKVGKIMAEMANKLQVIVITHLHQIAAKGNSHFYVYKDNSDLRTVSLMKKLSYDERVIEIATMIGGQKPSENAISSAKEILEVNL